MTINCVDLFCGIGGLSHGLFKGGVCVQAGIDIDERCRFTYEANNPARFISEDVRRISGDYLRSLWGKVPYTLLAGCAPCQPFSTYSRKARKVRKVRKRKQDPQWTLVSEFGRLVVESQPALVTMENVAQLLDHRVFPEFMRCLSGYHVWHSIVECSRYGIPQTRKRLVLLASRLGPISFPPCGESDAEHSATVREAIAHLRPLSAGESDPYDQLHSACKLSPLNLNRIRASKPGGTWRDWPPHLIAACHRRSSGDTYPSVYGRMEWDKPAPTITTQSFGYGNGRFGHPTQDRAITLREAAILQTFPASYRFLRDDERVCYYALGRLIGNAVPVRIGQLLATTFIEHVQQFKNNRLATNSPIALKQKYAVSVRDDEPTAKCRKLMRP